MAGERRVVVTRSWKLEGTEEGHSTHWAPLPTEMSIEFQLANEAYVSVEAFISRCQHSAENVNTEYR